MGEGPELAASRERMISALRDRGIAEPVLAAMQRVPRHRFVPHFWAASKDAAAGERSEWFVSDSTVDRDALDLVHDPDRGLGLRFDDSGVAVSTISAPALVGWTLELLDLSSGMRVLEVGTGSGWNAALLAEMVESSGEVVTVEIDEALAADAERALRAGGHDRVTVVAGDAYLDVPPVKFDRVVATVGCVDIAPNWLAQLADDGFAVIPLLHGGIHPTMKLHKDCEGAHGGVIGHSAFVAMAGEQSSRGGVLWSEGAATDLSDSETKTSPMPARLAAAVTGADGKLVWSRVADFAYFVALEDNRRALFTGLRYCGLADGDRSFAVIDTASGDVHCGGTDADELREQLIEIASRWLDRGGPRATDYQSVWLRHTVAAAPPTGWLVQRVDYTQIVTLPG